MYLSGSIEKFDGTIAAGGSHVTNSGTYFNSFTVNDTYEPWFRTVYKGDHPVSNNNVPSHIVVNSNMDEPSTVIVEQTGEGSAPSSGVLSQGTVDAKKDEPVYLEVPVVSEYFRVRTINGDGSNPGSITQIVRLKDRQY